MLKVVTHNQGKVREYRKAFEDCGLEMEHVNLEYDEIQTSELESVVRNGLEQLRGKGFTNFLIDDSGIFIDALNGFPGVYSAYGQKTIGNDGILKLMRGVKDRSAVFRCCIGCSIGKNTVVVTGECRGTILFEARGEGGFGYDPIFSPDGRRSFAEISVEEKNSISHRGRAVELLKKELMLSGFVQKN